MKDPRDVILRPVVSEKSYGLIDGNVYTFIVAPDANKVEIRLAVEAIWNVINPHRDTTEQVRVLVADLENQVRIRLGF